MYSSISSIWSPCRPVNGRRVYGLSTAVQKLGSHRIWALQFPRTPKDDENRCSEDIIPSPAVFSKVSINSATRPPDICSNETSGLQFFQIESWQGYSVGQATGTQRTDNGGLIVHLSYHTCFLAQPATLPQSHQQHLFRFALLHFSPNSSGHLSHTQLAH